MIDYYVQTALPNAEIIAKNATKAYQSGEVGYVEYLQSLETDVEHSAKLFARNQCFQPKCNQYSIFVKQLILSK